MRVIVFLFAFQNKTVRPVYGRKIYHFFVIDLKEVQRCGHNRSFHQRT
jgi:hypothetical protein